MHVSKPSLKNRPVIYCLHYLGGSAREWAAVKERLQMLRCVALDLPGFGDAARTPGYSVAEMAASVVQAIRSDAPEQWMIAGHSMGAKVAAVVARAAEDDAAGLEGLTGLVLLAGSPPSPEPMNEEQRQAMLHWFSGDTATNRAEAELYVMENANALDPPSVKAATVDVLRANREAWRAWLEQGSREDWSERIAVLQTRTLIIAGGADEQLGPQAQHKLVAPHFARVRVVTLPAAKHLLPLERPHEVARLIDEHAASIARERDHVRARNDAYQALIASERVSSKTREALTERERPEESAFEPAALDARAFVTLRALLRRVLPQVGAVHIDLAARIDEQLHAGRGDGWRFADLPVDTQAYHAGLLTLAETTRRQHGRDFHEVEGNVQDELLKRIAAGGPDGSDVAASPDRLTAKQMRAWFEDVRADAVKVYMSHPLTLARIGYSGIAYGGDGEPKSGFKRVGAGEREAWEPLSSTDASE